MGSIPGPGVDGPACAGQEAFAVGANQINRLLFERVAPAGCRDLPSPLGPRRIHQRQFALLQQPGAIRRCANEAEDALQSGLRLRAEFFGGDAQHRLLRKPAPVALPLLVIERGLHHALPQTR